MINKKSIRSFLNVQVEAFWHSMRKQPERKRRKVNCNKKFK